VVAFDTAVSREMLADLGLYADYGDADSLARRLIQALRDVEGGQALGRRLRERAETMFSWASGAQRIVELYKRIGARESLPAVEDRGS
jgi:glycosyltransferase involved in cell wall biosynthesis